MTLELSTTADRMYVTRGYTEFTPAFRTLTRQLRRRPTTSEFHKVRLSNVSSYVFWPHHLLPEISREPTTPIYYTMSRTSEITVTQAVVLLCLGAMLTTMLQIVHAVAYKRMRETDVEMVPEYAAVQHDPPPSYEPSRGLLIM